MNVSRPGLINQDSQPTSFYLFKTMTNVIILRGGSIQVQHRIDTFWLVPQKKQRMFGRNLPDFFNLYNMDLRTKRQKREPCF